MNGASTPTAPNTPMQDTASTADATTIITTIDTMATGTATIDTATKGATTLATTQRQQLLAWSKQAHDAVEAAYLAHPAAHGDTDWHHKQRLLLADMALHLLQTALYDGELSSEHLRRNLYAILTIAEPMLPGHQLKTTADGLYTSAD